MYKYFLLTFFFFLFISCAERIEAPKPATAIAPVDVDTLLAKWVLARNREDSSAIHAQFAPDATVLNGSAILKGQEAIARGWIKSNYRTVHNMMTSALQKWTSGDRASCSGSYSMDVLDRMGDIRKNTGHFAVNWKRMPEGWKIDMADLR